MFTFADIGVNCHATGSIIANRGYCSCELIIIKKKQ